MRLAFRLCVAVLAATLLGPALAHAADWRDSIKVLRVGVITGPDPAYRLAALEPFRNYLQQKLELPVEILPFSTIGALVDAQVTARLHYAVDSAAAFAAAEVTCHCVEPLVQPTAPDGARGFYSVLVSRADGPIKTLSDARGARLAVAGPDSIAGRLVPMKALAGEGIVPKDDFSDIVETADPAAAITALLTGEADLATGWSSLTGDRNAGYDFGVLADMVADGRLTMDEIRVVWQSPLIPFGPHVVLSHLPDGLKSALRDALLAMARDDPAAFDAIERRGIGGGGFVAADAGLYDVMKQLVAAPAKSGE